MISTRPCLIGPNNELRIVEFMYSFYRYQKNRLDLTQSAKKVWVNQKHGQIHFLFNLNFFEQFRQVAPAARTTKVFLGWSIMVIPTQVQRNLVCSKRVNNTWTKFCFVKIVNLTQILKIQ